MNGIDPARRMIAPAAVMAMATLIACLVAANDTGGQMAARLLALAFLYTAAVTASSASRRFAGRKANTYPGILIPSLGYATAVVMAAAAPIAMFDAAYAAVGPFAPPLAIVTGMVAVGATLAVSHALDVRLDPVAETNGPEAETIQAENDR